MQNNKGFTILEMTIVIAIIMAIMAMSIGPSQRIMQWMKEVENKDRIQDFREAFETVYKNNAWSIDSSDTSTFVFSVNGTPYALSNGLANTTANQNALRAIAAFSKLSSTDIEYDSMHNAWQVYVSNRILDVNSGIRYHIVAIVSPGWDNTLNSSFNAVTGALTLLGDDNGFVVNGFSIQKNYIDKVDGLLATIKNSYESYFTSLYLNDPNRQVFIDRFAQRNGSCIQDSSWDSNSTIDNSQCIGTPTATNTGLNATLGLSQESVTTPWGREVLVDNGSASVKNPDNMSLTLPYTALITAELPWGGNRSVTANGMY